MDRIYYSDGNDMIEMIRYKTQEAEMQGLPLAQISGESSLHNPKSCVESSQFSGLDT